MSINTNPIALPKHLNESPIHAHTPTQPEPKADDTKNTQGTLKRPTADQHASAPVQVTIHFIYTHHLYSHYNTSQPNPTTTQTHKTKQDTKNTPTTDTVDDIWGAGSDDDKPKPKVEPTKLAAPKSTEASVEAPKVVETSTSKTTDTVDDIWGAGSEDEKPKTKRSGQKDAVIDDKVDETPTPKTAHTIDDIWETGSDADKPNIKVADPKTTVPAAVDEPKAVNEPKIIKKTVKKTVPKSAAETGTALEPNSKKAAPVNNNKKRSEVAAVGEPIEELSVQPIVEEPIDDVWADSNGADDQPKQQPHQRVRDVPAIVVKSPTAPNLVEQTATVEEVLTDDDDNNDVVETHPVLEIQKPTDIVDVPAVKPLKSALKKPAQTVADKQEPTTVAADDVNIWDNNSDDLPNAFERAERKQSAVVEPSTTPNAGELNTVHNYIQHIRKTYPSTGINTNMWLIDECVLYCIEIRILKSVLVCYPD